MEVQDDAIAFLRTELQRLDGPGPVATVETHISVILLGASLAWKLKKAVQLPYLNFRAAQDRLALCERELILNRRTAPALYRAVRRVVRGADGQLHLDGDGSLVEAVLEMRRFDEADVLDRMAVRGALTPRIVTQLAQVIAQFHARSAPAQGLRRSGSQRIGDVLDINRRGLVAARRLFGDEPIERVVDATHAAWERLGGLLDERQRTGHVRLCHGDLHLRNIVCVDGTPTLFDCLEFDAEMATTDTLYDLAFVLMDLWHRDLQALANLQLNRYLDEVHDSDETAGLPLLGLFMAMRATVRAHVLATHALEIRNAAAGASGNDATAHDADAAGSRAYLELAHRLLQPRPARLVAVGGLSGSGKSTAAAAIAAGIGAPPGARILSSDRIRKALHGVAAQTRLASDAYRPEVSARVYTGLRERTAATLACGHSVIVDAVFDRQPEREQIEAVARAAGVPFHGIWLDAPAPVLIDRVDKRRGDPSDADAAVVRRQLQRNIGNVSWHRVAADDELDRSTLLRLVQ